jgi:deoxyribodipyrimidine photo-lyase
LVTPGFLGKHILIDWKRKAYFAEKLLDYELSSNNDNWQWAADIGCNTASCFKVFNPARPLQQFGKDLKYVKKWIPDFNSSVYIKPIVKKTFARERCINTFKKDLCKELT